MQSYSPEDLPDLIPVFPLPGALLLPSGRLPLNIFEPRYLSMVRDALKTNWLIGMIQPRTKNGEKDPILYPVGCAGKIISFTETGDGRLLITLGGLLRFKTKHELPLYNGYRRFDIDWKPFKRDLLPVAEPEIDRAHFEAVLRQYLNAHKIPVKWDNIENTSSALLVTSLAMQCPFTPEEKQALLEAPNLTTLTNLMVSLFAMAASSNAASSESRH
jgi:Lon protease-like protein